jgi:hypothetical protein
VKLALGDPPFGNRFPNSKSRLGAGLQAAMNLNLIDAFGKFGAKPGSRLRGLSAIATDGALVLNCSGPYFGHPSKGVLRYEDKLSRETVNTGNTTLLGQHLTLARDGNLPVRMVVTTVGGKNNTRSYHVRPDLIGQVVSFDGDHFIVDFTRLEEIPVAASSGRRK